MLKHLISISSSKDSIKIAIEEARIRPLDADLQVPDTTKFNKHTGWAPQIPFEKTMQDLLDYWRNNIQKGRRFLTR
jgi:GDPmannose 4,6-dehydratase